MTKRNTILLALGIVGFVFFAGVRGQKIESDFDFNAASRIPVLHGGRVKPLAGVAKNALMFISGKSSLRVEGEKKIAIEWLFEMMARPQNANQLAVFRIDHPEVLAIMSKRQDEGKYYAFNDLFAYFDHISEQAKTARELSAEKRGSFQRAIIKLDNQLGTYLQLQYVFYPHQMQSLTDAVSRFAQLSTNGVERVSSSLKEKTIDPDIAEFLFLFKEFRSIDQEPVIRVIPPQSAVGEWSGFSGGVLHALHAKKIDPISLAYAKIMDSYRFADPDLFNANIQNVSTLLNDRHIKHSYRYKLESVFIQINPFYNALPLYLLIFFLVILAWFKWQRLQYLAYTLLGFTFVIHTIGLIMRMLIQGRPPVTNLYSSAVFVGWTAILICFLFERIFKNGVGTLVSAVTGFTTLIVAHHLAFQGDTLEMMQAVLDSNFWLATHVVTITMGYGGVFVMGFIAHIYIFRGLFTKSLDSKLAKSLFSMTFAAAIFALLFSTVGTILGGIWADQSWGRFWGWDPKENGALLIVLWLAVMLHARLGGLVKQQGWMVLAVFANIITAFSWFGVNMLGVGLHSYGFMDKAFMWLVLFCGIELVVMWLGGFPRRHWKSKQ